MKKFKLIDRQIVEEPDLRAWAKWYEKADRHVGNDYLQSERYGIVRVSTVFLGLEHFDGELFETMIFRERGTNSVGLPPPDDLVCEGSGARCAATARWRRLSAGMPRSWRS